MNMHNQLPDPGVCLSFPMLVNSLTKHEAWMWGTDLSALCIESWPCSVSYQLGPTSGKGYVGACRL